MLRIGSRSSFVLRIGSRIFFCLKKPEKKKLILEPLISQARSGICIRDFGLAVEVVEEGGFGGVGDEMGTCPVLDAVFFGLLVGEFAFGLMTRLRMPSRPSPLFTYCFR